MDKPTLTPPIIVVDETLAAQLIEDGERILEGLTGLVDGLRAIAPRRLVLVDSNSPAAAATEPGDAEL